MRLTIFCLSLGTVLSLLMPLVAGAHPGGVDAPTPAYPPLVPDNEFRSPSDVFGRYAGPATEIVLTEAEFQPFAALPPRYENCQPGTLVCDEHHEINATLDVLVSINNSPPQPMSMFGPVATVAYLKGPTDTTGSFDTEMRSMTLVGTFMGNPVMIRESPTLPSLGLTQIADIGAAGPPPGPYHIDSFFDVFTELSLDGGQTWIPNSNGPSRLVLGIPEPTSFALMGFACFGLAWIRGERNN